MYLVASETLQVPAAPGPPRISVGHDVLARKIAGTTMRTSPVFAVRLTRAAIFVHRWLGVALCAVFLIWFPSGIGMMYWDFPGVSPGDRLQRMPALDASKVRLSPAQASATIADGRLP